MSTPPTAAHMESLLRESGALLHTYYGSALAVREKANKRDVVTNADMSANELLLARIHEYYPSHGIISEETGESNSSAEYVWTVDPLDGTQNFSLHTPFYGPLLSVLHKGEVILAGAFLPETNELIVAERGRGARLNGIRTQCTAETELLHSLGTGYTRLYEQKMHRLTNIVKSAGELGFSPVSSCAADAILVASARRDWVITEGAKLWDYAPTALILEEAGCTVTNYAGTRWKPGMTELVAANPTLHAKILGAIGNKP